MHFYLSIFRIGIIIFLLFYIHRLAEVKRISNLGLVFDYLVLDKKCRTSRGGSNITIDDGKGKLVSIEYYGKKCNNLLIGGKVKLYYSERYNFYYIPNNPIYRRYIGGLLMLFLSTFINSVRKLFFDNFK